MCRPLLNTLFAFVIIGTASLGLAQQPGDLVVVVVKEAKIQSGAEVVATSEIGHVLKVSQVRKPWLGVVGDGGSGWVRSSDVVPLERAAPHFSEEIRKRPQDPQAYFGRGVARTMLSETDAAIADFSEAIRLDPSYSDAFNNRGAAWRENGEYAKAKSDWGEAIRLTPERAAAYVNRAWLLATCPSEEMRDGKQAIEDARTACELTDWNDWQAVGTLAASYAETGDFKRAVEFQSKAIAAAPTVRKPDEQSRLDLYTAGRPYRTMPADQPEQMGPPEGSDLAQEETGPTIVAYFTRGDFSEVLVRPQYPPEQVVIVEPEGEFAEIDIAKTNAIMRKLLYSQPSERVATVEEITSNHGRYAPTALYLAASAMFELVDKDEATFWFYVAQVRARSDAMKIKNPIAHEAVAALNEMFGEPINLYASTDWQKLKATAERVVAWDRQHERDYDARWIALHGMSAFSGTKVPIEPKQRWAEINEESRKVWLKDFHEVMRSMEAADRDGDGQLNDAEKAAYL